MAVERIAGVAVEQILVIKPERVSFIAEPETAISGEPPVARPVLHVHGQLVLGVVVHVGQRPDQDVAQPEFAVEVAEAHFVVFPTAHEVLPGLDVVPHLEHHPTAALGLEVAKDPPGALGQIGGVNQIHAAAFGALSGLDVVARQAHVVRACKNNLHCHFESPSTYFIVKFKLSKWCFEDK